MSAPTEPGGNLPLVRLTGVAAEEISRRLHLDQKALRLLRPAMTPRQFIEALAGNKLYTAGIDFLAHALPPRESVWWGCLCWQHTCGVTREPWEKLAVRTAVRWALVPDESNRAAARLPAETVGLASPAGALAAAAYQTGAIGPPNLPPMPPPAYAWARAVAIAIKVAATRGDQDRIPTTQHSFLKLGVAIAEGRFCPKG